LLSKYYESDGDGEDMRFSYYFCDKCRIMFNKGCKHSELGCTDDIYNVHFIKKWKDKTTITEYDGKPEFYYFDDWYENANNVEVIETFCLQKNFKYTKSCSMNAYDLNCDLCK
jgi:hypothetical protein